MANKITLPEDKKLASQVLSNENELENKRIENGFLGRIWGNSRSVPHNIAATISLVLVFFGVIYTCICKDLEANTIAISIKDLWSIITPIITLSIGYLFGDKSKKD